MKLILVLVLLVLFGFLGLFFAAVYDVDLGLPKTFGVLAGLVAAWVVGLSLK